MPPRPWRGGIHSLSIAVLASRRHNLRYRGYNLGHQQIERLQFMHIAQAENRLVDTQRCQFSKLLNSLRRSNRSFTAIASDRQRIQRRLLNLLVGTPNGSAMLTQNLQLPPQFIFAKTRKDITRVSILGNQPQRFALTGSAYQNRWMRLLHCLRRIEQPLKMVILVIERLFIALPHLVDD